MRENIEGNVWHGLVYGKFENLQETFEDMSYVESIELEESIDENGETYFLIQIYDLSWSLTTIKCNEVGYNIHWGSSTPPNIKSMIKIAMGS